MKKRPFPASTVLNHLYRDVPAAIRESLFQLRQRHSPVQIESNGQLWEYVTLGQGKKAVLFLHGMLGSWDIWWQQMLALADQVRVVSVTYPPVSSLGELAQGLLIILEREKIDRVSLVGSSLGGYVAQNLMVTHPQRLEKVVLGNTFPPNEQIRRKNGRLIRLLPLLPWWLIVRAFRKNITEVVYPASQHSALVLAFLLEQIEWRTQKAQFISRAKLVIESFDISPTGTSTIPILIIESANDPLVDADLRARLKAAYPGATVYTFPEAGHFPYLNEAGKYTELLRKFLL